MGKKKLSSPGKYNYVSNTANIAHFLQDSSRKSTTSNQKGKEKEISKLALAKGHLFKYITY
jgi:hypothetical protein